MHDGSYEAGCTWKRSGAAAWSFAPTARRAVLSAPLLAPAREARHRAPPAKRAAEGARGVLVDGTAPKAPATALTVTLSWYGEVGEG